jgi:hypothetical protein
MTPSKPCVRCNRAIDAAARSCLYCNWWQADPPPPAAKPVAVEAVPTSETKKYNANVVGAIAFGGLLILAFLIGALIHGFEPSDVKAAQQPKQPAAPVAAAPAPPAQQTTVQLVPDNTAAPIPVAGPIQPPNIAPQQSTPVDGSMTEAEKNDASAVPSQQYGAIAQQQKQPPQEAHSVDPRSLSGSVYGEEQTRPRPRRKPVASSNLVQPVAEYEPVPNLNGHGHARLALIVGTDGRVHDINVLQPIDGDMGRLIGAVQSWRFRPATENGVPVSSRFTVDIKVE